MFAPFPRTSREGGTFVFEVRTIPAASSDMVDTLRIFLCRKD